MTSPSTFSRTRFLVFLCVSLLGLSSTSLLCLALEASPPPFHDPPGTILRSDASSVVINLGFCGVSTTALRFSSDRLFSASRRTLRAYTTPSSVRTRCSSVRSLFPSHTPDFHLFANFGAGFPDSFSFLWKMCKNCFSKLHQFSTIRSSHGTIEWGLYLVISETRNEPRCVSDNPSHQCIVCRWYVLCVFLHCCQHCSHLSLQLFLIVFDSSIALM